METEAAGVLSSWLAQLGLFGLGLVVIGLFVWLWLRESRAVRADTETALGRKDRELDRKNQDLQGKDQEIADLAKRLADSEARERKTYAELMECRYPKDGVE